MEVTYEIERFAVVVDHVGFLRLILVSFLWDVLDEHEFIWLLAHHGEPLDKVRHCVKMELR